MSTTVATKPVDHTPRWPERPLPPPRSCLTIAIDVEVAHLANPLLAVGRLLASEAGAFAHVSGDDSHLLVSIALPDDEPSTARHAEEWVRWVVHNAGVRGRLSIVAGPTRVGPETVHSDEAVRSQ